MNKLKKNQKIDKTANATIFLKWNIPVESYSSLSKSCSPYLQSISVLPHHAEILIIKKRKCISELNKDLRRYVYFTQ